MQFFLDKIWQFLLPIPMPWQMVLVFFLVMLLAPWLILCCLPWITVQLSQIFLLLVKIIAQISYFIDYQIARFTRKRNGKPPAILYVINDVVGNSIKLTQYLKESAESLFSKTIKVPWILNQKGWYALPLIIICVWFLRPHLGSSSFNALIDSNIGWWCSLEHWAMVGEWKPSTLTCTYPHSPSKWDTLLKTKEYELKREILTYTKEIDNQKGTPSAYYKRGAAYLNIENLDAAFKDYTESIKLESKYAPSYVGRGDIYLAKGDKGGAFKEYSNAVNADPQYALGYIGRGNIYLAMNDKDSAFTEYSKAVSVNLDYASSYIGRGDVYQKGGDKDAALQEYKKAIQIDSKYALAYIKLGNLYYYDLDNHEAAINEYNKAIDISLKNGQVSFYIEAMKRRSELDKYIIYVVKSGDSLNKIAQSYNVTTETIISINKETYILLVTDPENLEIGWKLKIPKK